MEGKLTRTKKYKSLRSGKKILETRSGRREHLTKTKSSSQPQTRSEKFSKYRQKINKKKMPFKKKILVFFLVLCCLIAIGVLVWLIINPSLYNALNVKDKINIETNGEKNNQTNSEVVNKELTFVEELENTWFKNSLYSVDYIGQIRFESGLIDEPIVQTIDNNTYKTIDFKTMEESEIGTVFMDYKSDLKSQNITIYGNNTLNAYVSGTEYTSVQKMFTPLKKLTNIDNYDENKILYLALEDEVRKYQIVSVFYCDLLNENDSDIKNDSILYNLVEFDDEYFENYKNKIKEIEFYDTGVDFTVDDYFLTLQTCIDEDAKISEIVLCKLIQTSSYDGNEIDDIKNESTTDNTLEDVDTTNNKEVEVDQE